MAVCNPFQGLFSYKCIVSVEFTCLLHHPSGSDYCLKLHCLLWMRTSNVITHNITCTGSHHYLFSGQIFFKKNLIILHKTAWYINDRLSPYLFLSQLKKSFSLIGKKYFSNWGNRTSIYIKLFFKHY